MLATDRAADSIRAALGEALMQRAKPTEIGVLVLVIGMFLILFIVTLTLGTPVR